jgi:hypothetical protein
MLAKIEYQPNTTIFIWDYDNFIGRKSKQIITTNSKTDKILKDEIERK